MAVFFDRIYLLKRTPLKRNPSDWKASLEKRIKSKKNWRQRRTTLRVEGHSEVSEVKREIQAVARDIVIARDGGCILRYKRLCNGVPGEAVLQADHLISRSNSATYADTRLIVCLCRPCHAWKSLGSNLRKNEYDALVKTLLPAERVRLWERCEADSWRAKRTSAYDWQLALVALKQELKAL
jgi:hypothetical protein